MIFQQETTGSYTHGKSWEMHTIFWFENLKGRDHLKDIDMDGQIPEWIEERGWEGVD
jgi:hypothetical protein